MKTDFANVSVYFHKNIARKVIFFPSIFNISNVSKLRMLRFKTTCE